MIANMCEAISNGTGKPCKRKGPTSVGGHGFCNKHAPMAKRGAATLATGVAQAKLAPALTQALAARAPANGHGMSGEQMATELVNLVMQHTSTRVIGWVLDGWKAGV